MPFNIEFLDFNKQLDLFEERGMIIPDRKKALIKIESIGYYKLKEFSYPLATSIDPVIYDNVNFNDVITRYYQDKNLRIYLLHAIEKIEVSIKTRMSYVLGKKYGPFGYLKFYNWYELNNKSTKNNISDRINKEQKFKNELKDKIYKSRLIDIHKECNLYNGFPSIWLAVDVLTFGDITYMLKNMTRKNLQEIASFYECTNKELLSWVSCLNFVRNMCAHNANIIDIKFKTPPVLRKEWRKHLDVDLERQENTHRIASVIFIVFYFINKINPSYRYASITNSIDSIIKSNDYRAKTLGFKNAKEFNESMPLTKRRKKRNKNKKQYRRD